MLPRTIRRNPFFVLNPLEEKNYFLETKLNNFGRDQNISNFKSL